MGDDPELTEDPTVFGDSNSDWSDPLEVEKRFELICSVLGAARVVPITDVSLDEEEVVDVKVDENKFSERLNPGFENEKDGGCNPEVLVGVS
mmetsp:Transcript_31202/g.34935  ORF Transcript_31202/g.34935 Transcript_31202/m.34935 type:complete len:92 (-) Transcript_31202:1789-2064(-)